ncbi:diacylglycerol kinase family protein [Parvicella tangerina]|uniref:Undecaprenol kinase n=1 Tax=Parvicella tangerina TaxID=2829795 RepID=A0A916NCC4_9FLAO|nr:diacylglycerol kinase family protein [Parvicella tangerina]CAG5084990.1 Undecaprenol kinase [Parvicella tangerina]
MKNKKFSLRERVNSFKYAFNGLKILLLEEHNARIHSLAAIVAIALGFILKISHREWLWIMLAIALVFTTEMINTAIETICDEITTESRPGIKKAKDVAAGAVLVTAVFALLVALFVFVL